MQQKLALLVGCGDLGLRCGNVLLAQDWRLVGVRRNPARLPADFNPVAADYAQSGSLDFAGDLRPEAVIATFNPESRSVAGYRRGFVEAMANLLRGLGDHVPRRVIMASSTRVYAERDGGWVDESSPLAITDECAMAIVEAENLLLESPLPASIVRFGGIYGAVNGRLLQRIQEGRLCAREPLRYSNRIHREDCAGFLAHLLCKNVPGEALKSVYTAVDDEPVPQYEVESWLAGQMGVTPLAVDPSPAQRSSGHKRCRNHRLHASAYQLAYPNYRIGYGQVLAARER